MPYKTEKQFDITRRGIIKDTSLDSVCKIVGPKVKHWLLTGQAEYTVEIVDGNTIIHVTRYAGAEKASKRKASKEHIAYEEVHKETPLKNTFSVHLSKKDYDIVVFLNSLKEPESVIKKAIRLYLDSIS